MKQKVFSFKKGMTVPSWVQYTNAPDSLDIKFGCSGKVFALRNGDLAITVNKAYFDSIISIKSVDGACRDLTVKGAGDNNNVCYIIGAFDYRSLRTSTSVSLARRKFPEIKNTVKTTPLPMTDPR